MASDGGAGTNNEELRARSRLARNTVVSLRLHLKLLCEVVHRRCNDRINCFSFSRFVTQRGF